MDSSIQRQLYFPEANLLITRFSSPDGVAWIMDLMPMETLPGQDKAHHPPTIIRLVTATTGTVGLRLECFPAFNYARTPHTIVPTDGGVIFQPQEGVDLSHRTADFWRRWLSRCTYQGRWREMVHRSVLTLKLLTFGPTGAIVAAPTCSLPEQIGGSLNWDYRYTWLRDAAFTLYGFMRVGLTEEAAQFMVWWRPSPVLGDWTTPVSLFERMLGYANHLGLYGEEISPTGETLGNFPQAFTHLGLISAAFNLDRALGKGI